MAEIGQGHRCVEAG